MSALTNRILVRILGRCPLHDLRFIDCNGCKHIRLELSGTTVQPFDNRGDYTERWPTAYPNYRHLCKSRSVLTRVHPKILFFTLLAEMDIWSPSEQRCRWCARMRCVAFWGILHVRGETFALRPLFCLPACQLPTLQDMAISELVRTFTIPEFSLTIFTLPINP
jgi:hypothetical protein